MNDLKCFKHSGTVTDASRALAVRRGGLASRAMALPEAPDPNLRSPEAIRRFVEVTSGRVVRGELHPELGKVSLSAAETALKIIEVQQLQRRLVELEGFFVGELGAP